MIDVTPLQEKVYKLVAAIFGIFYG